MGHLTSLKTDIYEVEKSQCINFSSAIGFKIHLLLGSFMLLLSHLVFQVHKCVPCIEVATLMQILSFCVQAKSTSDACLTQLKWTFNVCSTVFGFSWELCYNGGM